MTLITWLACGEDEPPATNDWMSEKDRRRIGAMRYTKRHDEARLSRWTAQRAVSLSLGPPSTLEDVEIGNRSSGAPFATVPGGDVVAISSTDRAGWAVCAVQREGAGLGCDLELVEPRTDAFVRDYFTRFEQMTVIDSDHSSDLTANLIWSAKESALKVLETGLRRDTRSVEVRFEPQGVGWKPLVVTTMEGAGFDGWWDRFGVFVLTIVAARPAGPPLTLVEPTPLATARPSHSWMGRFTER